MGLVQYIVGWRREYIVSTRSDIYLTKVLTLTELGIKLINSDFSRPRLHDPTEHVWLVEGPYKKERQTDR